MKQIRLGLAWITLLTGCLLLWNAHALKAEAEAFRNRAEDVTPDQFRSRYPKVVHFLELHGVYPTWPQNPVEGKNHAARAHRDLMLCYQQRLATGWSLLAVSGLAGWLHYRCPACRRPNGKDPATC